MIHFAAYTAAETPNAFALAEQPPEISLPVQGSRTHLILYVVPLAHASQIPNGVSIGSANFAGFTRVSDKTDRQTDHPTCDICHSRPHLCSACDAA